MTAHIEPYRPAGVPSLPSFSLAGRTALVTGACGPIGRAICHGLAGQGAHLVVVDHPSQDLEQLAKELEGRGSRALALPLDLLDESGWDDMLDAAYAAFSSVEILVNNAGINLKTPLAKTTPGAWNEMWTVNVVAPFFLSRRIAREQAARGGSLSIVNTSSIAGSSGMGRGNIGFSSTKAALNELTRELAIEWGAHGFRVNAFQPCQVEIPSFVRMKASEEGRATLAPMLRGIPLGRLAQPEDMAGLVVFLASDAAAMITGTVIPVDGGNLAFNAGGTLEDAGSVDA